ncbi:unnamed protein product, partial [Owenia fusiformis]
ETLRNYIRRYTLGILAELYIIRYFLGHWSGGMALCKISGFCEMLSAVASILNLTAVSVERYIVIVHPMRSRSWCTIGSAKKIIVIVWIASCLLSAPVAYVTGLREDKFYNGDQRLIMAECIDSLMNMERYIFAWYQLIVMFAVPTYIMVFCYARVIYVLWISTKELAKMTQRSQQRDSSHQRLVQASSNHRDSSVIKKAAKDHSADIQNARKQVIKMLITIILVFLICWGPKLILRIISRYPFKDHMNSYWRQDFVTLKVAMNLLPYIQSATNPIVYGFMSSSFRRSMMTACRSKDSIRSVTRSGGDIEMGSKSINGTTQTGWHTSSRFTPSPSRSKEFGCKDVERDCAQ